MKPRTAPNPMVRMLALLLLLAGVALVVGSVFADQVGLSQLVDQIRPSDPPIGEGLGWKQLIGAIVGLVLVLVGAGWLAQPPFGRR